ncbi:unnamed protein product, partial [Staurois parvus]
MTSSQNVLSCAPPGPPPPTGDLPDRCVLARAGIGTDHQGTDDQCPDDRSPSVPPTISAHLCPAVRPPAPISAPSCVQQCHHLCPEVPPTCAQQCHPPVPDSATHQCSPAV